MRGLGQIADILSQALFPVPQEVAATVDPRTVKAAIRNGVMQLGIGLMSAQSQGAGFGQGLGFALQQAQQSVGQGLGQAYIAKRSQREDERLAMYDQRLRNADMQADSDRLQRSIDRQRDEARYKQGLARQDSADAEDKRRYEERMALERAQLGAGSPVNQQLITRPVGNGMVQDFAWDPRSNQRVASGEPYQPVTTHSGNPTEGERVSANYAGRMQASESLLGDYQPGFKDYVAGLQVMKGGAVTSAAANAALSPQGQKYYQAAADWVRAKLRKESGAVIAPEEMAQEIKTYFPVPGDSKDTIAQKRKARDQALLGMNEMAGRAIPPVAGHDSGWSIEPL